MNTILKNVTLIDGTGRAPQGNAVIVIKDGKVVACHPQHELPSAVFAEHMLLIH